MPDIYIITQSVVSLQRKDAPLFTCQEEAGGDASFGLVSRVSSCLVYFLCSFLFNVFFLLYSKLVLQFDLIFLLLEKPVT